MVITKLVHVFLWRYNYIFLPARASEQGNVIGLVSYTKIRLITRGSGEYVIVKARQRGNYAANIPSPRALARGRGLSQHNFRGNLSALTIIYPVEIAFLSSWIHF